MPNPRSDIFEITGSTGKGDFDFSDHPKDQIYSKFITRNSDGTNALKRAHASFLYPSLPENEDPMHQFNKDFFRGSQIRVDGRIVKRRDDKPNQEKQKEIYNLFQADNPEKQQFIKPLNQALAADLMIFMSNNYTLPNLDGNEVHGIFEYRSEDLDIEYEKNQDTYSYTLKAPVYFFRDPNAGQLYARNHMDELVAVEEEERRALNFTEKYKPITESIIKATVDPTSKLHASNVKIVITSDIPSFRYVGPQSDPNITIKYNYKSPREKLFELSNRVLQTLTDEYNRVSAEGGQKAYLQLLKEALKQPGIVKCANLATIPKDEQGLRDAYRAFNNALEAHKDLQKKPNFWSRKRFTDFIGITKPETLLDSFRQDFLTIERDGPFGLQSQKSMPSEKTPIVHANEPKPLQNAAPPQNAAQNENDKKENLDVGSIVQVQEQFEQLDKAKPKTEQPQDIKDKKPYLIPHVTPEQHKTLMTELMGKFKKNEDGAAVDNKPDNKPKGMPPKGK